MNNSMIISKTDGLNLGEGWRYYNTIKKKAMEQEFSWFGLLVSLSIAFFVVATCSFSLRMMYSAFVA